jgi:hypothetical protein
LTAWIAPASAGDAATATETVIRLAVDPMPQPQPTLRYRLLPQLSEFQAGNPVLGYLKCFMEQERFFFNKESVAEREKYLIMPLELLPASRLRQYGGSALRQADYAARLETPDWQALAPLRKSGMGLLIPDVQRMRALAAALKVRFRAEVATRQFDDAMRTAQTMFALARHLGEHPTLVGNLVGISIFQAIVGPLEEMLGQSDCPNLYWALTILPTPPVEIRKGLEGDAGVMMAYELSWVEDAVPMDQARLEKAMERFQLMLTVGSEGGKKPRDVRAWVAERARSEDGVRSARQRLVAAGLAPEQFQRFPEAQVVLLDEKREAQARLQALCNLTLLPYWQMQAYVTSHKPAGPDSCQFGEVVGAVAKVRRAQARMEQRIGLLRVVEALRLYAAEHAGRWPERLEDVSVPLSPDPFTGQPFVYQCDGKTAHVRGMPPTGHEKDAVFNVHYEVRIRK